MPVLVRVEFDLKGFSQPEGLRPFVSIIGVNFR